MNLFDSRHKYDPPIHPLALNIPFLKKYHTYILSALCGQDPKALRFVYKYSFYQLIRY